MPGHVNAKQKKIREEVDLCLHHIILFVCELVRRQLGDTGFELGPHQISLYLSVLASRPFGYTRFGPRCFLQVQLARCYFEPFRSCQLLPISTFNMWRGAWNTHMSTCQNSPIGSNWQFFKGWKMCTCKQNLDQNLVSPNRICSSIQE